MAPLTETTINRRHLATLGPSGIQPSLANTLKKMHEPVKGHTSLSLFFGAGQADLRLNTSFYKLAKSCVFIKQSPSPISCSSS